MEGLDGSSKDDRSGFPLSGSPYGKGSWPYAVDALASSPEVCCCCHGGACEQSPSRAAASSESGGDRCGYP